MMSMSKSKIRNGCGVVTWLLVGHFVCAQEGATRRVVEERFLHLRSGEAREWAEFPAVADGPKLEVRFAAAKNPGEFALVWRQQDVKQAWQILLNGKKLGELVRDENDMRVCRPVAAGQLVDGENVLVIEAGPARGAAVSDDIRLGEVVLEARPMAEVLGECTLEVDLIDVETQAAIPARITIADANGSLQATANISNDHLAVREGVIYTADGKARVGLPAGKYTIYGGRGFEYSLAKSEVTLAVGEAARRTLAIRREVPTPGYVACDTHVHTFTHSGHGDATIAERMITLAGEGIEFPIATDHNLHIDYEAHAQRMGVRQYFTPVIGNEVTTSVGHFNVFPVAAGSRVPNYKLKEWGAIFAEIFQTPGVRVAVLNHARDLHSGTRPFGPQLFNAAVGENIEGWPMRFNAMEVINSGAIQTDPLRLTQDWMALLNRGYMVTPVGSSDSHDVARHFVGQGRTYIRCDDGDVSQMDVTAAVENFLAGRVMVSYGLLVEMKVAGQFQSGDLATVAGEEVEVGLRVLGPEWTSTERVRLFVNGELAREQAIEKEEGKVGRAHPTEKGVKWEGTWKIPRPRHDVHLVAIASGPGVKGLFWPTAKPYQPTSPEWTPMVLGMSGAVWVDGDSDGRRTSAREYAEREFAKAEGDAKKFVTLLGRFDAATAAQGAHLVRESGKTLDSEQVQGALKEAAPQVQQGFRTYGEAWRDNVRARAQR